MRPHVEIIDERDYLWHPAELVRGEGDALRTRIFAQSFGRDPGFAAFYRSMQAYEAALGSGDTTMVLSPSSDFFKYFRAGPNAR